MEREISGKIFTKMFVAINFRQWEFQMVFTSFFIISFLHLNFYSNHVWFLQLEKIKLFLFGERNIALFYVIIA